MIRKVLRIRHDTRGVAAIEFGILAPLFIALTFALFETGLYYYTNTVVVSSAENAARMVRTGRVQGNISEEDFFEQICNVMGSLGDCQKKMKISVESFDSFADLANDTSPAACRESEDDGEKVFKFEPGAGNDIIRVRVCYLNKVMSPHLGLSVDKDADGYLRIVSSTIFRNEPF